MNDKRRFSYSMQEREINLADLFWRVLYAWRALALWGILAACLLTGIKYVKDKKNSDSVATVSAEDMKMQLSEDKRLSLERAIIENASIERQMNSNTEYQKNSILMNIDPYNENQIVLQYYVNTNYTINWNKDVSKDYAKELVASYITYIENAKLMEDSVQDFGIEETKYLEELISTGKAILSDKEPDQGINTEKDTFSVYIIGKDMEQAEAITEVIQKKLEEYHAVLSSKIGKHDLVLVDRYQRIVQDEGVAEKQAKLETANSTLRMQQTNLKAALDQQQQSILEMAQTDEKDAVQNNGSSAITIGISKKYAVIGFVAGIFIVCVFIVLKYILDAHIKNEKEFQEYYGLRIIGNLDNPKISKKIFSGVDKWLHRIREKGRGNLEDQIELASANLVVTCKKYKIEKVFFTTSICLNDMEREILGRIMREMKNQGIETALEENMVRSVKALVQMSETGQVVLVEKIGDTEYTALEKELILCEEQQAETIGVIVVKE